MISDNYSHLPTEKQPKFSDRLAYFGQAMAARKLVEKISLWLSPILSYFSNPLPNYQIAGAQNFYLALGLSSKWQVTEHSSLTLQC